MIIGSYCFFVHGLNLTQKNSYALHANIILNNNPRNYWKFITKKYSSNDIPKQLSFNKLFSLNKQGADVLLFLLSIYLSDITEHILENL